jgi:hypothetical protein
MNPKKRKQLEHKAKARKRLKEKEQRKKLKERSLLNHTVDFSLNNL